MLEPKFPWVIGDGSFISPKMEILLSTPASKLNTTLMIAVPRKSIRSFGQANLFIIEQRDSRTTRRKFYWFQETSVKLRLIRPEVTRSLKGGVGLPAPFTTARPEATRLQKSPIFALKALRQNS